MRKRVGNRPLQQLLRAYPKRLRGREVILQGPHRCEKALLFLMPRQRSGILPTLIALWPWKAPNP